MVYMFFVDFVDFVTFTDASMIRNRAYRSHRNRGKGLPIP